MLNTSKEILIGFFDLFRKKDNKVTNCTQAQPQKLCPRCGHRFPAETDFCSFCSTKLYLEHENFCTKPTCQRFRTQYDFPEDEFFCDECGSPTIAETLLREPENN